MPRAASSAASLAGRRLVPGERENPRAGLQMRDDRFERPAVQRQQARNPAGSSRAATRRARRPRAPGCKIISSGEKRRVSIAPTPKKNGSPVASTQTGLPRRATIASSASSIGDGQASVSAPSGPTSARWRRPPTTRAACASRRRAAGERPSSPSSPMPTTASQRSSLMEPPPEAPSPSHPRRHVGSERARAPPGRRARRRAAPVARRRDRQPGARADPAADRRLRRRGGPRGFPRGRADRRVVDATHPFAARMSANAVAAAPRDRDAARRLHPPAVDAAGRRPLDRGRDDGGGGRRARDAQRKIVFLTQGRLQLAAFARAPQHRYVVRAIDRPDEIDALPDCKLILARGPVRARRRTCADAAREDRDARHQEQRRRATYPKIEAARMLGVSVVIVRPAEGAGSRDAARSRRGRWPGSRLIAAPRRSAASASTAGAPSRAMKRVSLEPTMTSVAMSTRPGPLRRASSTSALSSARPTARAKATGVAARLSAAQEIEGVDDARRPRLRGGIVERDDEIAFGRGLQAPLDDRPGLQIVGERDGAEIMAERRAEPRRRGLHGGDAGRRRRCRARATPASSSIASNTAAAMANTPGSPPETTATARPSAASVSASARAVELDAIVAGVRALAGPQREAARDRARSRRCRSPPRSSALASGVIHVGRSGAEADDRHAPAHGRRPRPGTRISEK